MENQNSNKTTVEELLAKIKNGEMSKEEMLALLKSLDTMADFYQALLDDFKKELKKFVKVMPLEYKRIFEQRRQEKKMQLSEVSDG